MEIIRKKLSASELVPPSLRYDPDTDEVQQTFDGGATWVDSPGSDPRIAPQWQKPPVVSVDPQCQAAENFTAVLQDQLDKLTTVLSAASSAEAMLTTAVGAVSEFFPEAAAVGVLAFLALDFATALFDAGLTAINAAFDSDAYEDIKCAYLNECASDGSMDAVELASFLSDIASTPGGLVSAILDAEFAFAGPAGASNFAATGTEDANCTSCRGEWCEEIDFTLTDGGFNVISPSGGTWVSGTGWVGTTISGGFSSLRIDLVGFTATINYASIRYSVTDLDHDDDGILRGFVSSVVWSVDGGHGGGQNFDGSRDAIFAPTLTTRLIAGTDANPGGSVVVSHLSIHGTGTAPGVGTECPP